MISLDTSTHRFHLRAAAVICRDDAVLLHRKQDDDFWALPGGRVEPGEVAAQTVARELREELGLAVPVGSLCLLVENFFTHAGNAHHEIGLYFQVALTAEALPTYAGAFAGREADLIFRWFAIPELAHTDVRPSFLKERLVQGAWSFQHVVHRSDSTPYPVASVERHPL